MCFSRVAHGREWLHWAQLSGPWRYIKTGTYPRRFFHQEPAVAPVMDTDIGSLLSAPRSRTGSWPCHKCEHLMDTRETHINKGEKGILSFLLHPLSSSSSQCRQPFLILAELTLRGRQQNNTHSAFIRFLCSAVALRSHLSPTQSSRSHFHPILLLQTHNPSPPY